MNTTHDLPVLPDPLAPIILPEIEPTSVVKGGAGEIVDTVLYYGILTIGTLIPIVGGIYALYMLF